MNVPLRSTAHTLRVPLAVGARYYLHTLNVTLESVSLHSRTFFRTSISIDLLERVEPGRGTPPKFAQMAEMENSIRTTIFSV